MILLDTFRTCMVFCKWLNTNFCKLCGINSSRWFKIYAKQFPSWRTLRNCWMWVFFFLLYWILWTYFSESAKSPWWDFQEPSDQSTTHSNCGQGLQGYQWISMPSWPPHYSWESSFVSIFFGHYSLSLSLVSYKKQSNQLR